MTVEAAPCASSGRIVSIVINNYNYETYVGRAIDSALAQSWPQVEVVVVDDGSTDGSRAVIAGYGGRIRCLFQENAGQAAAINAGFSRSRGDIVLFLDADDVLLPGLAAELAAGWRPETAKAQFALRAVDGGERPLGYELPNMAFRPGEERRLLARQGYYPSPPASGNAYARRVLERIMPIPEKPWRFAADAYLIALSALMGEVLYLPQAQGLYRVHGANGSEAGRTVDLALVRRNLIYEMQREAAIRDWSRVCGPPIDHPLVINIPGHCKTRLVSLRLDPAGHPFAGDRVLGLAMAGIKAAWLCPHGTPGKRLVATALFPVLALAPRRLLAGSLKPLVCGEMRLAALRQMAASAVRGMVRGWAPVFKYYPQYWRRAIRK